MVVAGKDEALIEAQWLEDHLHDPGVRLVEVDVGSKAYDEGHIEGAVLWNVYQDLKDADYLLIDRAATERLVAGSGIAPDSVVVFYGYAPSLALWLMKLYGHADVRILNCSRNAWRDEGRPWSADPVVPNATDYRLPDPDEQIRADQSVVQKAIRSSMCTIVDVRTDAEYRGERFWPSGGMEAGGRAGHVPSAVHMPIDGLYDDRGSFRPATELRRLFSSIDLSGDDEVITYCTIGGRASTAWFVLTYLLGRDHVRVYDGSWAEWGRMPATPVASA